MIVDAVAGHRNLVEQMKNTSGLFSFEIRRCPAVPSAQNWQKPVGRGSLAKKWSLWKSQKPKAKSHTSEMETRPTDSTTLEMGVRKTAAAALD